MNTLTAKGHGFKAGDRIRTGAGHVGTIVAIPRTGHELHTDDGQTYWLGGFAGKFEAEPYVEPTPTPTKRGGGGGKTNPAYDELRSIPCPTCGSTIGRNCTSEAGRPFTRTFHAERRKAVEALKDTAKAERSAKRRAAREAKKTAE